MQELETIKDALTKETPEEKLHREAITVLEQRRTARDLENIQKNQARTTVYITNVERLVGQNGKRHLAMPELETMASTLLIYIGVPGPEVSACLSRVRDIQVILILIASSHTRSLRWAPASRLTSTQWPIKRRC